MKQNQLRTVSVDEIDTNMMAAVSRIVFDESQRIESTCRNQHAAERIQKSWHEEEEEKEKKIRARVSDVIFFIFCRVITRLRTWFKTAQCVNV